MPKFNYFNSAFQGDFMKRTFVASLITVLTLVSCLFTTPAQADFKPFTINELIPIRRVSDPQLSPDGKWIAYTITDTDKAANRRTTRMYLISAKGGEVQQLLNGEAASQPRWSPDGSKLAFISAKSGAPQIWTLDVATKKT